MDNVRIKRPDIYSVAVDYSHSIEEMILACNFDCIIHQDVNSRNFLVAGNGLINVQHHLVPMYMATSPEALEILDELGLKPENLTGSLSFAAKHPDVQRECPIIVLGSEWIDRDGNRRVAYLHETDKKLRNLRLSYFGGRQIPWEGNNGWCKFIAVPK
jgi:hypothetical protein